MSTFTPTPEQTAVVTAAAETEDNLLVNALAGAAKTSTLVLLTEHPKMRKVSTLCLAFNKKIAVEMAERLPPQCQSMTLNSLGHRVWSSTIGKRLVVDTGKNRAILRGLIDALPHAARDEAWDEFSDMLRMMEQAKTQGYVPSGRFPAAKPLYDDSDFWASLDEEPSAMAEDLVRKATIESLSQAMLGKIDFSDQILMPTIFPASFPAYPLVMIDEAQDLSELNHVMLSKLVKKRLIAVGDPNQAIYGFRGAHENSMSLLKERFSMSELTLSISFRCPIAVVREAQWRAPHMRWPDWARPGEVRSLRDWGVETLPETAAIICRNNAPLFSMAIRLLSNGRYPELIGNDIGKLLQKWLKDLGPPELKQADVMTAIDKWEEVKAKKSRVPAKVADQAECLRVFARQGETLAAALAYADHVMNAHGPIQLMTGHKSKGLEFDTVFILDRHLVKVGQGQEDNLLYVMQTRAKRELIYVESETFAEQAE